MSVQSFARSLTGMTLIAAVGAIAYRSIECERSLARVRERSRNRVRSAGPDAMRSPPAEWDNVDQQVDESFPASDPPGNY